MPPQDGLSGVLRRSSPVIADGSAIVGYLLCVDVLAGEFEKTQALNGVILGGAYLVLCGSVYLTRRLAYRETPLPENWTYLLVFLAIAFAVYVLAMGAEYSGLANSLEGMDSSLEGGDSLLLTAGLVGCFALLMLYPLMLLVPAPPLFRAGSIHQAIAELVALTGCNLAIIVSVAQWEGFLSDVEPYESIGFVTKLMIFLPTYAFFLLFYGSPRLLFLLRDRSRIAIATFVLESGFLSWAGLERTAW